MRWAILIEWISLGPGSSRMTRQLSRSSLVDAIGRVQPLVESGVELRLHDVLLYNSIYRVDNQVLVNQHLHGIATERTPVFHFHKAAEGEMFDFYLSSFKRIWNNAVRPTPEIRGLGSS